MSLLFYLDILIKINPLQIKEKQSCYNNRSYVEHPNKLYPHIHDDIQQRNVTKLHD